MKEEFKISLAQICCKAASKTDNLKRIEKAVVKAKRQSADIVIFPELSLTGYVVRD